MSQVAPPVLPSNPCSAGRPPSVPSTISCVARIYSSQSKPAWHLLLALQRESFHPFPSCSISPASSKLLRDSSASLLHLAFWLPKLRGKGRPKAAWFFLSWLPCQGVNPGANLPLQPHFRLLPQTVIPASIPVFFQLYWAAIVNTGRHGSMAWSQ